MPLHKIKCNVFHTKFNISFECTPREKEDNYKVEQWKNTCSIQFKREKGHITKAFQPTLTCAKLIAIV